MRLKKVTVVFTVAMLLALIANGIFLLFIHQAHNTAVVSQERRQQATELTNQLRQEIEHLTRLVRAYTVTGESRYLFYYYDILAIRSGEKPEPADFNPGIYWDAVIAGRIQHSLPQEGVKYSLVDRMKSLDFSAKELITLEKIFAITEAMNKIEQIAFAATQGLYDPIKHNFVSDGSPHLRFASKIVHDKSYNSLEADLSVEVETLARMVEQRTNGEVERAAKRLGELILLSLLCMVATIGLMVLAMQVIRHRVLIPIQRLSLVADRLAAGDYSTRVLNHGEEMHSVEELVVLSNTIDSMALAIEDDVRAFSAVQQVLEEAHQQADEANRAKSMFLANMSHEIRTPMNAIIGMAYLALKTELTPRQRDYISKVHNAAKSLLGIIDDILDFSKIEANKLELEKSLFRLEDVVGNALSLLRQRAHEKEIELLFDISDPLLLGKFGILLGDSLRLGQILTNLLSNSVKFTHQGYVKLTVGIEERSEEDVLLRFTIRDTGIGMSPEQVGRLFQEFTQADGSTTRKYGGTGLGLTISKRFVELMGGRIWGKSAPGEGSSFVFTARFPVAPELPPSLVSLSGVEVLRVLIVDDQPEARLVLSTLLNALGVGAAYGKEIDCVGDGEVALTRIRQAYDAGQPYDLLLVDWVMPGMDGGAVLQALKESGMSPLPLPVVVSAYDSDLMQEALKRLDVHHFLTKPVLPEALRNLFNALASHAADEEGSKLGSAVDADLKGMRVLLVEDNPINQQLAVELMECRGIAVTVANNGQEALDQLAAVTSDYFNVVFMDLQMPVMDGYEATRRIRADSRYLELPLVAMTAHAMVEERVRCQALGMNGHLSKPIEPEDLYGMLARYRGAVAVGADSGGATVAAVETALSVSQLPSIVGLDVAAGLRRTANKQALYLKILAMFANDNAHSGATLAQQIESGQWIEAESLAHTIKGLSGTLGAVEISLLAGKLETVCRTKNGEDAVRALTAMNTLMVPLITALQQHFVQAQPEPVVPASQPDPDHPAALPDCLPRLRQLLGEGDSDAIDLWAAHQKEFANVLPLQIVQRIGVALDNFEFDAARTLLSDLPDAGAVE